MNRLAWVGAVALLATRTVTAYELGIFADSTATTCSISVGSFGTAWVIALLGDDELPIVGTNFSIRGIPADSPVSVLSGTPGVQIGSIARGGVLSGYFEPQHASSGILPIASVLIVATRPMGPTRIWIDRAEPWNPSVPGYQEPVLFTEVSAVECRGEVLEYVPVPVIGRAAVINGSCSTAVQPATWWRVKSLYRE